VLSICSVLVWLPRPAHGTGLSFTQKCNKVRSTLGEWNAQQACYDLEAGRQLQVRKVLRDGLGNLNRAKVLQAEVLCDDENLLPMRVWP